MVEAHRQVSMSGYHNFEHCRIPIPTKLHLPAWYELMINDPDKELVPLLEYGFPINYTKDTPPSVPLTNHASARNYPQAVDNHIRKEMSHGATIGPFTENPFCQDLVLSPLQTVPKKGATDNQARRIVVDLSYPDNTSVNAGIPKDMYLGKQNNLCLPSVDSLIALIQKHGQGCLIFKLDLSRAYRQLFLCPGSINLCGYQWRGNIFVDITWPFGIRSACLNAQRVAEAVIRIYKRLYQRDAVAYIDDFGGAEQPAAAHLAYKQLVHLITEVLGLTLAPDKSISPTTCLIFLGLELDTIKMELRVPADKLAQACGEIKLWLSKTTASKKQLQSLLGKLIHLAAAIRPGRRFVSRIIDMIKAEDFPVKLDTSFHLDITWWDNFMVEYNGASLFQDPDFSEPDAILAIDSGLTGCRGHTSLGHYFKVDYPESVHCSTLDTACLQLLTMVVACRLWGHLWPRLKLVVRCDNETVCSAINFNRTRHPYLQRALRALWFLEARHDFTIRCVHIPGLSSDFTDPPRGSGFTETVPPLDYFII